MQRAFGHYFQQFNLMYINKNKLLFYNTPPILRLDKSSLTFCWIKPAIIWALWVACSKHPIVVCGSSGKPPLLFTVNNSLWGVAVIVRKQVDNWLSMYVGSKTACKLR